MPCRKRLIFICYQKEEARRMAVKKFVRGLSLSQKVKAIDYLRSIRLQKFSVSLKPVSFVRGSSPESQAEGSLTHQTKPYHPKT